VRPAYEEAAPLDGRCISLRGGDLPMGRILRSRLRLSLWRRMVLRGLRAKQIPSLRAFRPREQGRSRRQPCPQTVLFLARPKPTR